MFEVSDPGELLETAFATLSTRTGVGLFLSLWKGTCGTWSDRRFFTSRCFLISRGHNSEERGGLNVTKIANACPYGSM